MGSFCSRCFKDTPLYKAIVAKMYPSSTGDDEAAAEGKEYELAAVVAFSDKYKGKDVELKKDGNVISGSGTIILDVALVQTRSYFEVRIVSKGSIYIGVTSDPTVDANALLPKRANTWCADASSLPVDSVLGASYDMSSVRPTLRIYKAGKEISAMKTTPGNAYFAIAVDGGAVVQANFGPKFDFRPPGFDAVIPAYDLL